jgi:hypothetical protein
VFSTFFPLKVTLKAVSVCRFFEERQDYLQYVGKELDWTGGLWYPPRKELLISPIDWASRSEERKMMIDVVYHEGFHQYLHYAINEEEASIWFNEGNATFFEGIVFKADDKFTVELPERLDRIQEMKGMAHGPVDIKKFVSMSHKEFIEPSSVEKNYALAWGLMFFLHKGANVLKDKNNYSEIPMKYYDAIIETRELKKADETAWKDIDMKKFEKDFTEFWQNDSLIRKAEKFDPFANKK